MAKKSGKYYLAETYEGNLHTASVVRKDNEKILRNEGFTELKFRYIKDGSVIVKLRRLNELIKLGLSVKKNDLVVMHFPLLANAYKVLLQLLGKRGVKSVAIIIDIDGLRYNDENLLKKEMEILQQFTHIIAHNSSMKAFLSQYIGSTKISCIELFDYPLGTTVQEKNLSNEVCYAGNFEKAGFVNKLDKIDGIYFSLYGPSFKQIDKKNLAYKGVFGAGELPQKLQGSFGLVWDGDSVETCDGYLRFNNPYKLSLYLAAGLPVIVWDKSATAKFVLENNIGITVQSLTELAGQLKNISIDQYDSMKQNIEPLRQQVISGDFLRKAINDLYK